MAVKKSRRQPACWLTALCAAMALAAGGVAAQQTASSANQELYNQAISAKTPEELGRVLQRIETLRTGAIGQPLRQYLTDLQAWVHHRRGETYASEAARANAAGDAQAARILDAQSLRDFNAAIQLAPTRWKSYHHRGVCLALAGRFEDALRDLSKTIELSPAYADAWFNRGEIHYELGRFAKAVDDYSEAIRLESNDAGFHTSRGHALFQLRRFQSALADYDQAVALDPENAEAHANRGDAHRSLGNWELAANDFRQAIELNINLGRAYQSAAWLMATCPDARYRNPPLAVRAAEKAIALDGNQDYIYLDTLAAAYASSGQFDRAQETIRRAIQRAPAENVAPLKRRLNLYAAQKPFHQEHAPATAARATKPPVR